MRNFHARRIPRPAAAAGVLLDQLASPDDALWPAGAWPALRLDRGLQVGSAGGHGPIRYHVSAYEPGRRVELTFGPTMGVVGTHTFRVDDDGDRGCVVSHEMVVRLRGRTRLTWPLAIRWLHDACIEDLLDNAEEALTGALPRPARWSPWVRFLRHRMAARLARRRVQSVAMRRHGAGCIRADGSTH